MLMINVHHHSGANAAVMGVPGLLCVRVNATELPNSGVDGDGAVVTGEVVLESENNGHFLGCGTGWVAMLSVVFAILATC